MMRPIAIRRVANGYVANVGCMEFIFPTAADFAKAFLDYSSHPDEYEKETLDNLAKSGYYGPTEPPPAPEYGAETSRAMPTTEAAGLMGGAAFPDARQRRVRE